MNAGELAALGAELQRELRLQDWRVDYQLVSGLRDTDGRPVESLHDRLTDNKTATIAVDAATPNARAALLRELVALHIAPLTPPTAIGARVEAQMAEAIGGALLEALAGPSNDTRAPVAAAKIAFQRTGELTMREQHCYNDVARRMGIIPPTLPPHAVRADLAARVALMMGEPDSRGTRAAYASTDHGLDAATVARLNKLMRSVEVDRPIGVSTGPRGEALFSHLGGAQ